MTEVATEVSTEFIADTVTKALNISDMSGFDIFIFGLLVFFGTEAIIVIFKLIQFLYNMFQLEKVCIYIENLTDEQINTIIETGKIETINGISFSLSMQKTIAAPCQIVHKTRGQDRNEIIVSYNDKEYNIEIPESDVNKYQIGDTVNVKMDIVVSENNTETIKSCKLFQEA